MSKLTYNNETQTVLNNCPVNGFTLRDDAVLSRNNSLRVQEAIRHNQTDAISATSNSITRGTVLLLVENKFSSETTEVIQVTAVNETPTSDIINESSDSTVEILFNTPHSFEAGRAGFDEENNLTLLTTSTPTGGTSYAIEFAELYNLTDEFLLSMFETPDDAVSFLL